MATFEEMQATVREMYKDTDERRWLFTHTTSQDEFAKLRRALKTLAEFEPVDWIGKTGNRRPIPCRNNHIDDKYDIAYDILMENAAGVEVI